MSNTRKRTDIREKSEELATLYNNGLTAEKLAIRFSCSKRLILNILHWNNVKMRKSAPLKGRIPWNKGIKCPQTSGEKNGLWKGGITPVIIKIRRCWEYKQWVLKILQRDNYTCQNCSVRGGYLESDHYPKMFCDIISDNKIKTFEDALLCKELWDINNGRTLCKNCHRKTFKFKGNQFISAK